MLKPADVRALYRKLLRAACWATWPSSTDKRIVWNKIRAGINEHRNENDADHLRVLEANGMGPYPSCGRGLLSQHSTLLTCKVTN